MKVGGPDRVGAASVARGGPAKAAGGFSLGAAQETGGAASAAPTSGLTGVASIDALLALQEVGGPLERRRKAVRRASRILDVLDEVKVALLDGGVPADALTRLVQAVREQREDTGEPGLERVLGEIETRAAVELAKLEPLRSAA